MSVDILDDFRGEVESAFGRELLSLMLYGSRAEEAPEPGRPVSAMIVVRKLERAALARLRKGLHRFLREGIALPAIFTEEFLARSADVFPLEYLGLLERRRLLAGRDVIAGIAVSRANLRHQVEFELKGKLLSLRRMYLAASGRKEEAAFLQETVGPVVSVARGLLLLADRPAPQGKEEIVDAVEASFGLRLPVLRELLAASRKRRDAGVGEDTAFAYMEEVERLCAVADTWPPGTDRT